MSLRYKQSTIQPEGRLSYGHYLSSGNITNSVVRTSYYGDGTTNTIGGGGGGEQEEDYSNFYMFLSKESGTYNAQQLAVSSVTDTIQVIGYRQNAPSPTLVMNLDACVPQYDSGGEATGITTPDSFGISGISDSGMTVAVTNNGTSATTIAITFTSAITASQGEIIIPCNIYLSTANMFSEGETLTEEDMLIKWYNRKDNCRRVDFKFTWKLEGGDAASVYTLDLSNEVASVNCDSGGTVLPGAQVLPECQATLYFGTTMVSGATFSANINPQYNCTGVSMVPNESGATVYFGSNFQFSGNTTPLAIEVVAQYLGSVTKKTMTVYKNLAGADGTLPVSRWLVPNHNQIVYDPNSATTVPDTIRCSCWMQVGGNTPQEDSATTIYWKYEGDNSWTSSEDEDPRSGITNIDVSKSALIFALMNEQAEIYESETVPILKNGRDGSGTSSYRLDLDNQNASINCDSSGNILAGAVRPECTATLYFGDEAVEIEGDYYYAMSIPSRFRCSGVSINSQTGVIHFNTSAETPSLYWSGTTMQITVEAWDGAVRRGKAIMNVSKNLAGADGTDAVTYWLAPTANAVKVDSGGTANPTTISCKAWKQVGENTPVMLATSETPYIYWGYDTDDPSTRYSGQTITINTTNNSYLTFQLWYNNTQYDIETIPFIKDGQDGSSGSGTRGPAVRGPVDWYSGITANRRFCNGIGPNESDKKYIDILYKDGVYYECTTSYDGSRNDTWNSVKNNWTSADTAYNFVATELLLATNGKINFLTGNEIYLMDSGGTISGGARAATDDNGIVFWAGAREPENGNFQVDFEGNIYAKSGTFAGYIQMPYTYVCELVSGYTSTKIINEKNLSKVFYADDRAYLISDTWNNYSYSVLMLPEPSSGLNGMMYEIIVEPGLTRVDSELPKLIVTMSGNSYSSASVTGDNRDFRCFAYSERFDGQYCILEGGRFQFTCMPINHRDDYTWAITLAQGELTLGQKVISALFSYRAPGETGGPITKLVPYTGTKPTVNNEDNTVFISRD